MEIHDAVRQLRERAGLSQPELAQRSGLGIATIQNWEAGRTEPRLTRLMVLVWAMGFGLADFEALLDRPDGKPGRKK